MMVWKMHDLFTYGNFGYLCVEFWKGGRYQMFVHMITSANPAEVIQSLKLRNHPAFL